MIEKYLWLFKSRKAQAMGVAFAFFLLNWILGWGLTFEQALALVSPLFAWAGIEGLSDAARVLSEGMKAKDLRTMDPEALNTLSKSILAELERRSSDGKSG